MERNEPIYARDLCEALTDRFRADAEKAEITLTGGGVQWRCCAQRGHRTCWVGCFEVGGPEYLTFFEEDGRRIATGRTPLRTETVNAVWHWLDAAPLDELYRHFCFVDWEKRQILAIRESVLTTAPDIAIAASNVLSVTGSGVSHLWFHTEKRSAHIHFASRHEFPQAVFHWDQSELFRFDAADKRSLAAVLARWLADNAPPSKLRKEFPWLQIGPLADYYEKGNPVEGEFIESWDQTERVYEGARFPPRNLILPFISDLRRAGFDRKMRAGQSVWSLIISRSRRPRLRPEQPLVSFQFRESSMEVFTRNQEEHRISVLPIEMSDTVERALSRLAQQPID